MEYKKIKLAVEGGIAFVKLNSPESFNALTLEMSSELLHALEGCNIDPKIRVVILSGEGKAFCAGGDLKAF
ncbi:MAG: enoyl-CoA hydratase/isomerase family protein, partial [bacterium]|nr:enoyl-CoA hydratase/isomerase family protein [bacterium]